MRKLLLALMVCVAGSMAFGQDLLVAAAADLNFVLPQIVSRFEHKTGKKVAITFGSSGNFYQQIRNGAPFDLFFSADEQYPAKLNVDGLAEPGTLRPYAVGKIVLAAPAGSRIDLSAGLRAVLAPEVRKIAIANPQHAPYGRVAVEALQKEGVYEKVQDKLVLGENVSQTAQFVQSGNADVGIIALSLASAPSMKSNSRFVVIPDSDYSPIRQAVIIIKSSKRKEVARAFLQFMQSEEILNLMSQYGFAAPDQSKK